MPRALGRRTIRPVPGWTANVNGERHDDLVWSYPAPLPESQRIGGLVAFYNNRVTMEIDGVTA